MHPKVEFPGKLKPIIDDLAAPSRMGNRRDPSRAVKTGEETSLADGYRLEAADFADQRHAEVPLDGFRRFMATVMGVSETADGFPLRFRRGEPDGVPADGLEAHRIRVAEEGCEVDAVDVAGLRRAVARLEDETLARRAPILPIGDVTRWTTLRTRIVRSPIAPYRWLSGWELTDPHDYYPESYLEWLAQAGINGVWIPGLLRHLVASSVIPELGPPEHRLDKLNQIVAKTARHGIGVYFFCIEPRALPNGHPALVAHPEIAGARTPLGRTLCSSRSIILDYVRDTTKTLFAEVPELAGMINIFCGERPTTCHWRDQETAAQCERCASRSQAEVLSETLNAFAEGIRAAGSQADFLAWSYFIGKNRETSPIAPLLKVMEKTSDDVIWLGNFEHGCDKELCGKKVKIHEYSLSCVGPSSDFRDMAATARQHGREIHAKLQMGASYELSSVPYVPVPGVELEKIKIACGLGATGSMMTWIPGGAPSVMLKAAGEAAFDRDEDEDAFLTRIAAVSWGEKAAEDVKDAWKIFAEAWTQYPFDNEVLYWGPITRGPAYQLHLEREERLAKPYNFGYTRKREPQPWEDEISRWVGPYSAREIFDSFRRMADHWKSGLEKLESARMMTGDDSELDRQIAVAKAVRLHFLAAANAYEFYDVRNKLLDRAAAERATLVKRMMSVARDDVQVAKEMRDLMAVEPLLGFESELFDFSYTPPLLDQKVLQVQDMLSTLERWVKEGVQEDVLRRTVEEAEATRPDRDPDRWGD